MLSRISKLATSNHTQQSSLLKKLTSASTQVSPSQCDENAALYCGLCQPRILGSSQP